MLNEKDDYSIGWAQRHCIEHQKPEIITEYVEWFKKNVLTAISKRQAEHLIWDLEYNYIPSMSSHYMYEDYKIPEIVYEYINMLKGVTDESKRIRKVKKIYPLVKWACKYCMTRKSYAATYINDVIHHYFGKLTLKELEEINSDVKTYADFCDKLREDSIAKNPDYYKKHPYLLDDICPAKEWRTFMDYMNPETHKIAITIEDTEFDVFYDSMNNKWRPVNEYLQRPWSLAYLPEENIKTFKTTKQ